MVVVICEVLVGWDQQLSNVSLLLNLVIRIPKELLFNFHIDLAKIIEEFLEVPYRYKSRALKRKMRYHKSYVRIIDLPDLIELLYGVVIEGSLFMDLYLLVGLANNGDEKLQQDQTHDKEIAVEV
jgi:hypothetical protein